MSNLEVNEYICDICKQIKTKLPELEEQSLNEAKELWGIENVHKEDIAEVCDPCFQHMMSGLSRGEKFNEYTDEELGVIEKGLKAWMPSNEQP